MAKRASEWIPQNILVAAEKARLGVPLWYVGRSNGHDRHARKKTLDDLVIEAKSRQAEAAQTSGSSAMPATSAGGTSSASASGAAGEDES